MFGWFRNLFKKTYCVLCKKTIKHNETTGTLKYRYVDKTGESKITTSLVCSECLAVMEEYTPEFDDMGDIDETV